MKDEIEQVQRSLQRLVAASKQDRIKSCDAVLVLSMMDDAVHQLMPQLHSCRDRPDLHFVKNALSISLDRARSGIGSSTKRSTSYEEAMKVLDAPDRKWTRSGIR